jgi:hypothetical protein
MNQLMKTLPIELIHYIRFMTYCPKPKELLYDIQNYNIVKSTLSTLYYKRFICDARMKTPEDRNWLSNDIYMFINNKLPSIYGYTKNVYDIFNRNPNLSTRTAINKYIIKLNNGCVDTEINIVLGLLTPEERYKLTGFCIDLEHYN